MKNNTNKYKILVLSDLKNSSRTTLKSTISLAKMINGDIEFFHVKKPTEVVENENQLSAMRTINADYNATEKKIRDLIVPLSLNYETKINYKFAFGNIKNEITKHIEMVQPDIIVLGKRKPKVMKLLGDSLTEYILKKHKGAVMISAGENAIEPGKEISLGLLNGAKEPFNLDFAEHLLNHSQEPLKSFKINGNGEESTKEVSFPVKKKMVEYVFDKSDNAINNISSYLTKNNVDLFCIDRGNKNANLKTLDNLKVSLLVTQ